MVLHVVGLFIMPTRDRSLSVSAIHSIRTNFIIVGLYSIYKYHFEGTKTLTMEPYYTPPEINIVMAKALVDCSSQCQPCLTVVSLICLNFLGSGSM